MPLYHHSLKIDLLGFFLAKLNVIYWDDWKYVFDELPSVVI